MWVWEVVPYGTSVAHRRILLLRDQNGWGNSKNEIGTVLCHVSKPSPSGVGKQDHYVQMLSNFETRD